MVISAHILYIKVMVCPISALEEIFLCINIYGSSLRLKPCTMNGDADILNNTLQDL